MKWQAYVLMLVLPALVSLACCREKAATATANPLLEAYDYEQDPNDPQHAVPLNYEQGQGKRMFYNTCVWCHAESTPAGPSNRSNVTPTPPLLSDGETLNSLSDEFLQNVITFGGSAMGKSSMMPPWGQTLSQEEIRALIAYFRAVAQPPYQTISHRPITQ